MDRKHLLALAVGLLLAVAPLARADSEADQLRAKVAAMEARMAQLEGQQNQSWLNERRAEEVKALVREVLADADTRASLMGNAMSAGHNGKNFFLASDDGSFLMTIAGQIQFRYVVSFLDDPSGISTPFGTFGNDAFVSGFEVARTKLTFAGHIADPRIGYKVRLAANPRVEAVSTDTILLTYKINDAWTLYGGEDKAPFLKEDLIDSSMQLAVERSFVGQLFSVGYAQGVGLKWDISEMLKFNIMLNDGMRSGSFLGLSWASMAGITPVPTIIKTHEFDNSDFAITGRLDWKVMGDWAQADDFTAWGGANNALFVGAAFHYEKGETGDSRFQNDLLAWTIDAQAEMQGFGLFAAVMAAHVFLDEGFGFSDDTINLYGFVVQGSYNINDQWEPFLRYEYVTYDEINDTLGGFTGNSDLSLVTFGLNWYQKKHNAKFTFDVVFAIDAVELPVWAVANNGITGPSSGLLPESSTQDSQVVLRAQYQLLF